MITSEVGPDGLRDCFADPIPEIFEAANLLNDAVTAHLAGDGVRAAALIRMADIPAIGEWLDPIWSGQNNEIRAIRKVSDLPAVLPKEARCVPRDADPSMKRALVERDGFHCRLCGIPLVRPEVRKQLVKLYPDAARWTGQRSIQQHRGLQVMWMQFDHVIVHSRGGPTTMDNLVVTCPACNFGRDRYMMSEVGLRDPRIHLRSPFWQGWKDWDGLERILPERDRIEFNPSNSMVAALEPAQFNLESFRRRVVERPIGGPGGNHSLRLSRVAENLQGATNEGDPAMRLQHLISRVGQLSKGLADDMRSGELSIDEAATILDQLAELGEIGFEQWLDRG